MLELEAKVADIQGDLNKKQRAFESDANEFQTKVQKGLLTQSQAELQNRQLNERLQALQNEGQIKQNEIAEEQAVLLNKVFDAVQTYHGNGSVASEIRWRICSLYGSHRTRTHTAA